MKTSTAHCDSVPSHFFDTGRYEVWAKRYDSHSAPVVKIADGLSLASAQAFNWRDKQIRLNGKVIG